MTAERGHRLDGSEGTLVGICIALRGTRAKGIGGYAMMDGDDGVLLVLILAIILLEIKIMTQENTTGIGLALKNLVVALNFLHAQLRVVIAV